MALYQEINQQQRAMGRFKKGVDRRLVAKVREAFDRSSDRAAVAMGVEGARRDPVATLERRTV